MAIIFDHIIEANKLLFEYGYKLSLKDACGASCLQLKNLDGTRITTTVDPLIYSIINQHFIKYGIEIEYSESKEYLFGKSI
ncbi:RDAC family protein [Streptobacillus moniliformis]|uniref:Uncharacterized protein n=1 Tax=Streptobacillus moniliformis (strain ATCC 14647 / DSM 12112 / NCTC 10651 / 9901) TaxID=519441 RepID=D1AXH8_STRM9|nr:hypothetical protein [Streptobacillus moniliformis]ACZ01004.1 hypothetical protein Smon_0524 [Streptobacillus moniliformis DSM 12112]AVL42623.1 hypothetical protein CEP89_01555 [Streptobacillus moniliformis]QXW65788.1 hypothetical protein KX935_00510 [Streptobacillus moniliformis]SQA13857.1 Uncharacterised protein [Streptobacillus moniliformis]SQA14701.1 Uncharacterised protein [Streptobacillus moniliformis]